MFTNEQIQELTKSILDDLNNKVFIQIDDYLEIHPEKRNTLNPAFPFPQKVRIAVLKKHLVIEFCGPEDPNNPRFSAEMGYFPTHSVLDFIGVDYGVANTFSLPVGQSGENFSFFLGDAGSYLCDYFYDFTQLPFEFIVMNGICDFEPQSSEPIFISNTSFFWTDSDGRLMIKHVDFMEIVPFMDDGISYRSEEGYNQLAEFLINYEVPKYNVELHRALNELIELVSVDGIGEVEITSFIEKNPEIIQYALGTHSLNPQVLLEWQYDEGLKNLKPDFMPERMDGFCDILEFKLPHIKSKSMVGTNERLQPSYEIDAAIAQLNCYEKWCSQRINTDWLEKEKGIKVLNPQRILVMGHSKDFTPEHRRELREQRNVTIFTYDEFIDLARYQIYRFR